MGVSVREGRGNGRASGLAMGGVLGVATLLAVASCGTSVDGGSSKSSGSTSASTSASPAAPNGIEKLKPAAILTKSTAAALAQTSVRVTTETSKEGQVIKTDAVLTKSNGGSGTASNGASSVQFVVNNEFAWIKGSADYWTKSGGAEIAAKIGGKWVKFTKQTSGYQAFGPFAAYDAAVASILKLKPPITKSGLSDLNGQPSVIIQETASKGQLWIAATGEPLPIQSQGATKGNTGKGTFSEWGTATPMPTPTAAESIDASELQPQQSQQPAQ